MSHADRCKSMADEIHRKLDSLKLWEFPVWDQASFFLGDPKLCTIGPSRLPNWTVEIPRGGNLQMCYEHLNWWQRTGFRFLGWKVTKGTGNE